MIFNIHNALSQKEYSYFIISEEKGSLSSDVNVIESTISCKGDVDKYYELFREYLEHCNLPLDYLYAQMNSVINSSARYNADDLFIGSMTNYRVHTFRFNARIEKETTISYTT